MLVRWNQPTVSHSPSRLPAPTLFDETLSLLGQAWVGDPTLQMHWNASVPSADIIESEDQVEIALDLPGYDPESMEVRVEGDVLTVKAERKQAFLDKARAYLRNERRTGITERSFVLPTKVDSSKCHAQFRNGVLTLTIPTREEAKPRLVQVKVES